LPEGLDFGVMFGGVEFGGELGIALCGSSDGGVRAAGDARGDAATAAIGQQGEDFPPLGFVERRRSSAAVVNVG